MGVVSGIVVFVITWWLVLFAVLPWGSAASDRPEPGHAASAPAQPRLRLKFAVTTASTAVIWVAIFLVIESDLVSFREMSQR